MSPREPSAAGPSPHVATVVINWHRRDDTLRCLRALAALTYPNHSLILVDNDSADFSPAEVAAATSRGTYLRTERNLGFAGGANLGMHRALSAGADLIWFLNNDAAPEPEALSTLVALPSGDPRIAVVGPKILRGDDARRLDSLAVRVDLRGGRVYLTGHDEIDRGQYDNLCDVDAVTGCAMLVSRPACEALGGFDESFFAYLEDVDLCLRARRAGWRVCAAPAARVHHHRAAATRGRQSLASLYYATRNHLVLMRRHGNRTGVRSCARTAKVVGLNAAYALRPGPGTLRRRLQAVWSGVRAYRCGITGGSWTADDEGARAQR